MIGVDDDDTYSLDCCVFSIALNVFSLPVLKIRFVIVEIYSFVDITDPIDEVWSLWEVNRLVNSGVTDEMEPVFKVVTVFVDTSFVCSVEYTVDWSSMDVTTVEVTVDNVTENVSTVVGLKVIIVVSLVDSIDDEDAEEYSVEVETSSFVVAIVLVKDSVVSKFAVDNTDV